MNAVVYESVRPLVVLERDSLISQALQYPLAVAGGAIYRVSDLHRTGLVLRAQSTAPILILAGKPPESDWSEWISQVRAVIPAPCLWIAVDCAEESSAIPMLTVKALPDTGRLGESDRDRLLAVTARIQNFGISTLTHGLLHADFRNKTVGTPAKSVTLEERQWSLLRLFFRYPLQVLSMALLQRALPTTKPAALSAIYSEIHMLRSYLRYLGFDNAIINFHRRGYQFIPPVFSPQSCMLRARMGRTSTLDTAKGRTALRTSLGVG